MDNIEANYEKSHLSLSFIVSNNDLTQTKLNTFLVVF